MLRRALALATAVALGSFAGCGGDESTSEQRTGAQPRLETVATGLEAPWEIAFLPDGSALVTERPGRVRLLSADGDLRAEPVAEIDRVSAVGEGGLLGLAVDPQFADNGFVYLYRTTESGNEVVRFTYRGGELLEDAVIVDGLAAAAIHDGGRPPSAPTAPCT